MTFLANNLFFLADYLVFKMFFSTFALQLKKKGISEKDIRSIISFNGSLHGV